MKTILLVISTCAALSACVTAPVVNLSKDKIDAPKVVFLKAEPAPWTPAFESEIRKQGFKVLRLDNQKHVTERVSSNSTVDQAQYPTRYILMLSGETDPMRQCMNGAYYFSPLSAELVDTQTSESVMSFVGSGYGQSCGFNPSLLFSDIAKAVNAAWR